MARLNRRRFICIAGIATAATVAAACAGTPAPAAVVEPTQEPAAAEATAAPAAPVAEGRFKEAPALAEMVAAGTLPPVDERLPKEPMVVEAEEIGAFGGVWKQLHIGSGDQSQNWYLLREPLGRHSTDYGTVVPNLASGWEWSNDGKTVTFQLREGLRWSDGAPFTANDVMWWYENVVLNDELSPTKPSNLKRAGELAVFEKVDDYSFSITFAEPYGAFEEFIPSMVMWAPGHFLQDFHASFADEADLQAAMDSEGFTTWTDLYSARTSTFNNPGTPEIIAWTPTNLQDQPVQIWERNPYYWKVDAEGNQLPYLDRLERTLLPDVEALLLKAIAGDADYQSRRVGGLANYPVVKENEEKGNYRIFLVKNVGSNYGAIFFNFYHKDPVLNELFNTLDFRIALSVAVDRDELNALLFRGQATPGNVTASVDSPWYKAEYGTMYAQYDPDMANQLLDEIGLTERDGEGFRLRSDGSRLSVVNLVFTPWPAENVEMQGLIKDYWQAVGVEMIVKPTESQLWSTINDTLDYDVMSYIANHGWPGNSPITRPTFAVTANEDWAPAWSLWYASGGAEGEEPPAEIQELQGLYDQILAEADADKRNSMYDQALKLHAENLWMLGMLGEPAIGRFGLIKNDIHNMPIDEPVGWEPTIVYTPAAMFKA